jgi:hypothetical protein
MRWKQALGAAAVLGALISNPLAAQQPAAFSLILAVASDSVSQPSTWAAERAQMMRTAEHDLRTLQFDEARISRISMFQGATDPVGVLLQLFPSQAVVFTVEQPHDCPKAARQS